MFDFAAAPTPSPAIDPTVLAILSIFGGALIAALAGLIGAWIQARREHRAWLREKRYEAFVNVKVFMRDIADYAAEWRADKASGDMSRRDENLEMMDKLKQRIAEALGPVIVLGPAEVNEAGSKLTDAIFSGTKSEVTAAEASFVAAMQRSLGIRD